MTAMDRFAEVINAVFGRMLGNKVGGGIGKIVATVVGAASGVFIGYEFESRQKQQKIADSEDFTIHMENSSYQKKAHPITDGFSIGDRMRIAKANYGVVDFATSVCSTA